MSASFVRLSAVVPMVIACALGASAQQPRDQAVTAPSLTLQRVAELRAADLTTAGDGDGGVVFPSDQPGLRLAFALRLPRGVMLMDVEQPAAIRAADSTGRDLTAIDVGMDEEREFIDIESDFDDDDSKSQLTLRLALAARAATTFDVDASFQATVYTGTAQIDAVLGTEWTPLQTTEEGLRNVQVRATDDGVEIKPADAEPGIDRLEVRVGDDENAESNGWFSDGQTLTYMFDGLPEARPLNVRFFVRTGVHVIPLTIRLTGQTLP